ncbi:MAG: hypothetical protein ABIJ45_05345 [Candidatus Zixiibacteriota bacterium]
MNKQTIIPKKIFHLSLILLILIISCNSVKNKCPWTTTEMTIDGARPEWSKIPFNYFEDQDVVMGSCNDSNNLYLIFSFKNIQWAQAISRSGLKLWFDNKGKKNKDFGILYIGGPPPDEMRTKMKDRGDFQPPSGFEDMPDSLDRKPRNRFARLGSNDKQLDINQDGSQGPAVGLSEANGIYTYEFSIPLESSSLGFFGIGVSPGQLISIGAEWGGMDKNMNKMRPSGDDRGDMGGGGFPGGGGGMGGGPPGGGMGDGPPGGNRQQIMEKQEVWLKTELAGSQNIGE